jgi:cell division septation protein DedD
LSESLEIPAHSGQVNSDHSEPAEPLYEEGEAETENLESIEENDEFNGQDLENMQQPNRDDGVATENTNVLPVKESDHHFDEDILKQALSEPLETPADSGQANSNHSEPAEPLYDEGEAALTEKNLESKETNDEYNDLDQENLLHENSDNGIVTENTNVENTNNFPKMEDDLNFATISSSDPSSDCKNTNNNGISRIVMAVIVLSAAGFTASNWMTNQKIEALKVQIENMETRMNNSMGVDADQVTHEKAQHATNSGQENGAILMQLVTQIMENREAIEALKQPVTDTAAQNNTDTAITVNALPATSSENSITSPVSPKAEVGEVADEVAGKIAAATAKAAAAKQEASIPEVAKPVLNKKGRGWNIILMTLKNETMADRELAALLKSGVQAEKHAVEVHGETLHELRIGAFEQIGDARAYKKNVISGLGYKDAWIKQAAVEPDQPKLAGK